MSDTFLDAAATRAADGDGDGNALLYSVGARVLVHSLSARAEINRRTGTIVRPWQESNGRCGVLVDGFSTFKLPEKCITLKRANLSPTSCELCVQLEDEARRSYTAGVRGSSDYVEADV